MKSLDWSQIDAAGRTDALVRPAQRSDPSLQAGVRAIVDDVRARGWQGLCEQAERLDGAKPQRVAVAPIAAEARRTLAREQVEAIELAACNVRAFHEGSFPA